MKRVYVIVLDEPDEETPEWDFFEDCVKQSALESWDTTGYSFMGHTDVIDPEHPDWEGDPDDDFDMSDLLERVGYLVSEGYTYIKTNKAEDDGEA